MKYATIVIPWIAAISVLFALVACYWQWHLVSIENSALQSKLVALQADKTATEKMLADANDKIALLHPPSYAAPTPTTPYDTLYNPEASTADGQSASDAIKKRFEGVLVTYLFLRRCGQAQASDYHVIISALAQEMASINAPGRLQYDILTSAQGTYKEMYSKTECSDPSAVSTINQYNSYLQALSKRIPQFN